MAYYQQYLAVISGENLKGRDEHIYYSQKVTTLLFDHSSNMGCPINKHLFES